VLSDFLTSARLRDFTPRSPCRWYPLCLDGYKILRSFIFELDEAARLLGMVWAMSFPPRKLDRLSINITSNVFSTLETVANSVECSYQMESSMKNTKNYSRTFRLQPPPLYGLLASRHISYGKSECSHIFYAKPLAIRTGVGAM
jgi:hypothetical protein